MRSAWQIRVLRFTELWITYTGIVPALSRPILESRCVAFSHCVLDTAQAVQWPFEIPIRFNITPILERCAQYQLVCPILVLSLRPCLGS